MAITFLFKIMCLGTWPRPNKSFFCLFVCLFLAQINDKDVEEYHSVQLRFNSTS